MVEQPKDLMVKCNRETGEENWVSSGLKNNSQKDLGDNAEYSINMSLQFDIASSKYTQRHASVHVLSLY